MQKKDYAVMFQIALNVPKNIIKLKYLLVKC